VLKTWCTNQKILLLAEIFQLSMVGQFRGITKNKFTDKSILQPAQAELERFTLA
jgi:hypothetical protein